ncbi:MAG: hypothetical protein K2W92_01745 [Alphaproteobacteria bacterium]|nr:hypothetical protein [Alphaproteobacteria bacterium]
MIKFMKCAISTAAVFLSFTVESPAKAEGDNSPIRISAIFKEWNSNFDDNVTITLPGGESKGIVVTPWQRLSIDEAYTGLIEGREISYTITSLYGVRTQEGFCKGNISLHEGELTLEAIQLQFTIIAGADPKQEGPWFTCEVAPRYK